MKERLIAFEAEVARRFEAGLIRGPIHLSGGNEDQLIEIFNGIKPTDFVFSTWRSHYHAILHGIPEDKVMDQIMEGRSMNLMFPEHNFFTSAIVGGVLPIAVGVAYAMKVRGSDSKVYSFIGDMTATCGIFEECRVFSAKHHIPAWFYVEDNGLSCNTPTTETWGGQKYRHNVDRYVYERQFPHTGIGKWVTF